MPVVSAHSPELNIMYTVPKSLVIEQSPNCARQNNPPSLLQTAVLPQMHGPLFLVSPSPCRHTGADTPAQTQPEIPHERVDTWSLNHKYDPPATHPDAHEDVERARADPRKIPAWYAAIVHAAWSVINSYPLRVQVESGTVGTKGYTGPNMSDLLH